MLPHVMSKLNEQYPVDYKLHSECFNDKYVTAHHAIIPTMSDFNIAQLLPDERRVYEEICRYYIMQFLPPIRKRQLSAIIKTEYGDLRATSTYAVSYTHLWIDWEYVLLFDACTQNRIYKMK